MKKTEVDIRGYDTFFTIQLKRKEFMTLEEVKAYVEKDIINTAIVVEVRHKRAKKGKDIIIKNPAYKPSKSVGSGMAEQYLKKQ